MSGSRRTERVAHQIRRIIAGAIQARLNDPRIPPITSITRVEVSPDFAVARIHVSVMAPPARRRLAVEALQSAAGHLRRELAPELRLRHIPTLVFRLDESVQGAMETVEIIDRAMQELGEGPAWERAAQDDASTDAPDPKQAPGEPPGPAASGRDTAQEEL